MSNLSSISASRGHRSTSCRPCVVNEPVMNDVKLLVRRRRFAHVDKTNFQYSPDSRAQRTGQKVSTKTQVSSAQGYGRTSCWHRDKRSTEKKFSIRSANTVKQRSQSPMAMGHYSLPPTVHALSHSTGLSWKLSSVIFSSHVCSSHEDTVRWITKWRCSYCPRQNYHRNLLLFWMMADYDGRTTYKMKFKQPAHS